MLGRRIFKLILIRLLVGSLFLFCPKVVLASVEIPFYAATTGICLVSIVYLFWYLSKRWYRLLVILQIVVDILLETYLILFTGGAESLFVILFPLTILSSALVSGERVAIYGTTVLAVVGYFSGSLIAYRMEIPSLMPHDAIYFFYGTAMRIVIFLAIGQLGRYLSRSVAELQSQLKLAERLTFLGVVVSKISHEVRNPLSAIRTAAEVLRDSLRGTMGPQEEKMIQILDTETERLTKTLQRILNYAKQVQPSPKMLALDPLIDRVLNVVGLQRETQRNGIVVEKKYDAERTRVFADEEQILSALLNLILNAYQAMPNGGHFKISAEEGIQETRIDVQDTGPGIPLDKLKNLFVPFKTSKKGGTGLGLAEVHKIVTLHEGKIEVESEPGKGTIFHLHFPKP